MHLKPWKTGGLQVQLTPKWTDPTCDPNHPSALKSQGSLRGGITLEGTSRDNLGQRPPLTTRANLSLT